MKNRAVFVRRLLDATPFHLSLILCFWLLSTAGRLYVNGDSLGFDFSVFQPDGVLYALRTYMFLGHDPLEAAQTIENWYFYHGASGEHFDASSILPQNSPAWGLVAPRVLYPILSMPFVALMGMSGLLVVPSISLLILVAAIYFMSVRLQSRNIGLVLSITVMLSPTVLRWMIADITDSLFVGLFAITALVLIDKGMKKSNFFVIAILIVLTNLTRFATPIWLAVALVDFGSGRRKRSIGISIIALLASVPTFLTQPSNSVLPREGNLTIPEKLIALPVSFAKVGFYEIAELAVLDRLLLILIVISVFLAFRTYRSSISQRYLFVLLSTWAIGAINGSIGVNFRYQLPALPFACAVIAANAGALSHWFFRGIRNIEGKETKEKLKSR